MIPEILQMQSTLNFLQSHYLRYGNQIAADEITALYGDSRANGFGSEVGMHFQF